MTDEIFQSYLLSLVDNGWKQIGLLQEYADSFRLCGENLPYDCSKNRCTGIKDIHSLAKVKVLTIDHCEGISDYDALLNVPRLKIIEAEEYQYETSWYEV